MEEFRTRSLDQLTHDLNKLKAKNHPTTITFFVQFELPSGEKQWPSEAEAYRRK